MDKGKSFDWGTYHREVAKAALQGLLANPSYGSEPGFTINVTKIAVTQADRLIKQLRNTK